MDEKIYQAIPAIMAEIGSIGKDRKNTQQGYAYRGIEDFYNTLHPLMVKHKVFTVPEVVSEKREERTTAKGSVLMYTTLLVKYTFHAEDGSFVVATVTGEGMDSGDKSSNKALSVAHKYALAQIFCVPTTDLIDPEVEGHEVKPRTRVSTEEARETALAAVGTRQMEEHDRNADNRRITLESIGEIVKESCFTDPDRERYRSRARAANTLGELKRVLEQADAEWKERIQKQEAGPADAVAEAGWEATEKPEAKQGEIF